MDRRQFIQRMGQAGGLASYVSFGLIGSTVSAQQETSKQASGPLRVSARNPRYFCDQEGRERLLVGSHTWNSLVDMGRNDPPQVFDFGAYLDFLDRHGHNFIRLWTWDSTTWDTRANGKQGKQFEHRVAPSPWLRSGPGVALDGKPKFDLQRFNPEFFERLRERVSVAGRRGIYVSVMLFEGWGLLHGNRRRGALDQWAWRSHPFHPDNNSNGIDADGKVHRLSNTAVNEIQAAYIRKVVDSVNEFDNLLYEVINEGGEQAWDWWVVDSLRDYQGTKPKQHPIGITGHGTEDLKSMLASPADWISPGSRDGYKDDPPAWDGKKVSLLDTDHVWGIGGNAAWVWKSFVRGHNPLFMDPYDGSVLGQPFASEWDPVRRNLGHALRLAERLELATMVPRDDLASSQYCLANPGKAYVVYVPEGGQVRVSLGDKAARFAVEWIQPATGAFRYGPTVAGGPDPSFSVPFQGDAVLYLSLTGPQ